VPQWIDPTIGRPVLITALVVMLAISRLPQIVLEAVGVTTQWWAFAAVGITVVLWVASRFVVFLRPLERFLAVMVAVGLAVAGVELLSNSVAWEEFAASLPPMVDVLVIRVVMAIAAIVVLGAAFVLGASRDELYLRVGDLGAPTGIRRKSGAAVRWSRFGPIAVVALMLLMVWFTAPMLPAQIDLGAAAPYIGVGAVAALLNAFWEEAAFRASPLSFLQRAVGPGAGVIFLALWFGLGHYYGGVPSGVMGFLASGASALLFGRAMIETRGLAWPVGLHFAGDLVIFTMLALAAAA
jgi:membrane protease YdiL (CAAX protease family)